MNLHPWRNIGIGILAVILTGCMTAPRQTKSSSILEKEQMRPIHYPTPPSEGSLWSPESPMNLYMDVKARNVGDIITINIVESASASKNASTSTERSSSVDASWSGALAKMAGTWVGTEQQVGLGNNFDGQGETSRSSYLNAYITAQVVEVLPNGNLIIWGSREVKVNNENQYINIQGMVRPVDISSNNIVLSTFIAEAKIELSGEGVISDKQRVGWLARVLDWVWPF